jgi:DNA-binding transcriptional regulator YdaS (Cro superfamily)
MATALQEIIAERVLSRPPILEATRACGFTDADVARLLGCTPMQVNDWAKGRRPIPAVKHCALALTMMTLCGAIGKAPAGPHAKRAQLLEEAVRHWTSLAFEEVHPEKMPFHKVEAAVGLANEALEKLGGGCVAEEIHRVFISDEGQM